MGSRDELEDMLSTLQSHDLRVHYDAVLNHRMGADNTEEVRLSINSPSWPGQTIEAWTLFDSKGRDIYYTQERWGDLWHNFDWDHRSFSAVDYCNATQESGRFLFEGKTWQDSFSRDYLMGANISYYNYPNWWGPGEGNIGPIKEMKAWGEWIVNDINFDGFRLDAIVHIDDRYTREWLDHVQSSTSEDLFLLVRLG